MQNGDPELTAMAEVLAALSRLERDAQGRVLGWAASKLGIHGSSLEREDKQGPSEPEQRTGREGTINTVCARLAVKSCRDLFKAAAFHLSVYQAKDRFSRAEWVACAKEAKHWKTDYSVQMATAITRLLNSGFVNETAKEVYSVPDEELREIDARIG